MNKLRFLIPAFAGASLLLQLAGCALDGQGSFASLGSSESASTKASGTGASAAAPRAPLPAAEPPPSRSPSPSPSLVAEAAAPPAGQGVPREGGGNRGGATRVPGRPIRSGSSIPLPKPASSPQSLVASPGRGTDLEASAAVPTPAPAPTSPPTSPPALASGSSAAAGGATYPHVDAIFYPEDPGELFERMWVCIEILPPGVAASSVRPEARLCQGHTKRAAGAERLPAAAFSDGQTPGVDTSASMRAEICCDGDDFRIPKTSEVFAMSPGEHHRVEFDVVPKRWGTSVLTAHLYTLSSDGSKDAYDGEAQIHVEIGHEWLRHFGAWAFEHWDKLAGLGASLLVALEALRRWLKRFRAGSGKPASPHATSGNERGDSPSGVAQADDGTG